MALTTNFSSASKEQRWVDQISKKFIREVTIDISDENPICVYNVPKSTTIFKPEAYIPEVIALGPYHHMDQHLYHMERYKIAIAKSFFSQSHLQHGNIKFQELLIDKLKELDSVVRGCYHGYLDFDDNTLSWIVAIDGLFLLNLLQNYFVDLEGKKMQARDSILSRDLMLLENQIPLVLLEEISKTVKYNSSKKNQDEAELLSMMATFCRANSPLKLAPMTSCSYHATRHLHLLDLMYHLIVNNGLFDTQGAPQDEEVANEEESEEIEVVEEDMNTICDNIGEITKVGLNFGIGRKVLRPVQVIQDMPWDKILTILGLKYRNPGTHEGPVVEEIKIPSVSSLHYYAGITFRSTSGGIRDVKFVEEDAALYLPVITLDVNSESVLRNLVAYETAMNYSHFGHSLSEFVDLISGIIDDSEDARLLRQKGIIEGGLTNDQIAKLFNGVNKSTKNFGNKTVSKINNYYKKRLIVKVFKFMKTKWFSSWKVITSLSTVLLLLLLVLYSFCEFHGCSKHFDSSSS